VLENTFRNGLNIEYLEINKGIKDRTALRDLDSLIEKGVCQRIGEKKSQIT